MTLGRNGEDGEYRKTKDKRQDLDRKEDKRKTTCTSAETRAETKSHRKDFFITKQPLN